MVAAIGEPFLLSNYDGHRRDSSTSPRQTIYVAHERSSGSKAKDGCATITVHGDGVHVFDVRSSQFLCMHKVETKFYPVIPPACCWLIYTRSINDVRWSLCLS